VTRSFTLQLSGRILYYLFTCCASPRFNFHTTIDDVFNDAPLTNIQIQPQYDRDIDLGRDFLQRLMRVYSNTESKLVNLLNKPIASIKPRLNTRGDFVHYLLFISLPHTIAQNYKYPTRRYSLQILQTPKTHSPDLHAAPNCEGPLRLQISVIWTGR